MKHDLKISLRNESSDGGIVRCRTVTFRERLLSRLFGEKRRVMVIVPGDTIECVSIREVPEEGDPDE